MSLNYSVHPSLSTASSRSPSLPSLHYSAGEAALALDTNSATIVGPCELHMIPGENVKIDVKAAADAVSLNPATSPVKLLSGLDYWFAIGHGSWKIKVSAA